jgi:hypothetical protein
MNPEQRKAAVANYRERKSVAGIYAVICRPTGQRWIGRAPDLGTIQNRLWFTLRHGGCPHRALQAAWNQHGGDAFSLEIVERIEDEALAYVRDGILKERLSHWCSALGADAV